MRKEKKSNNGLIIVGLSVLTIIVLVIGFFVVDMKQDIKNLLTEFEFDHRSSIYTSNKVGDIEEIQERLCAVNETICNPPINNRSLSYITYSDNGVSRVMLR